MPSQRASWIGLAALVLTGCQSVHRELALTQGYSPPVGARILLAEVKAPQSPAAMTAGQKLRQALNDSLAAEGLAWRLKGRPLLLTVEVLEYTSVRPSWVPGVKTAVLSVRAILTEQDRIVGTAQFGWRKLQLGGQPDSERMFAELARALVQDLRKQLHAF